MGIFDLFSTDNEKAAADMANAGLQKAYGTASDLYGQGRGALTNYMGKAATPFETLFNQSQGGSNAYADASGANGAEGLARAKALFQQTPGYSAGLDSGLDALDRRAASRGMLGSGNLQQDTLKFANDYASQKYGSYLAGLSPYLQQGTQSAAGLAGVYGGLGSGLDRSFQGQGQLGYQTEAGIGKNNAAAELAKDQTGLNVLGSIFKLGELGMKGYGMGMFG